MTASINIRASVQDGGVQEQIPIMRHDIPIGPIAIPGVISIGPDIDFEFGYGYRLMLSHDLTAGARAEVCVSSYCYCLC